MRTEAEITSWSSVNAVEIVEKRENHGKFDDEIS